MAPRIARWVSPARRDKAPAKQAKPLKQWLKFCPDTFA
jgi:hypothetical protein